MWKPWRDDTPPDLAKSFKIDIGLAEFGGHRLRTKVLKSDTDTDEVLELIVDNYDRIVLY